MKTIGLINQKGGTGKTTTAINLGGALAAKGKNVLLIDFDPQANLTYSFGIQPEKGSITEFLQGKQPLQTLLANKEGLDILPSSPTLADFEVSIVNLLYGSSGYTQKSFERVESTLQHFQLVRFELTTYDWKKKGKERLKTRVTRSIGNIVEAYTLIDFLAKGQKTEGLGLKQLRKPFWEIRVGLDMRVLIGLEGDVVSFAIVGNHAEIHRYLKHA